MRGQASLQRLEAQIAKLQRRADVIRAREKAPVVQAIVGAIHYYQISPEDLGISEHSRGPWEGQVGSTGRPQHGRLNSNGHSVAPKYRHPKTGETWSGRGRTARWLAEEERKGRKRESFLIQNSQRRITRAA